jgi:hypothetical protein
LLILKPTDKTGWTVPAASWADGETPWMVAGGRCARSAASRCAADGGSQLRRSWRKVSDLSSGSARLRTPAIPIELA